MYSSPPNFPEVLIIVGVSSSRGQKYGTITTGAWHVILLHLPTRTVKTLDGTLLSASRLKLGLAGLVAGLESLKRRTVWSLVADERFERYWFARVKRWKRLLFKHKIIRVERKGAQQDLWRRAICSFRRHWNQALPSEFDSVRDSYLSPAIKEAKKKAIEYRDQILAERESFGGRRFLIQTARRHLQQMIHAAAVSSTAFFNLLCTPIRLWTGRRFPPLVIEKPRPEDNYRLGERGERYAAWVLNQKGYRILTRNWHGSHYELDIVAQDGETIVFVEVKTRSDVLYNDPERNVFWEKQRRICCAALEFMEQNYSIEPEFRFDTIGIVWPDETMEEPELARHIINAFHMIWQCS